MNIEKLLEETLHSYTWSVLRAQIWDCSDSHADADRDAYLYHKLTGKTIEPPIEVYAEGVKELLGSGDLTLEELKEGDFPCELHYTYEEMKDLL